MHTKIQFGKTTVDVCLKEKNVGDDAAIAQNWPEISTLT